jgi:cyclopropane fatty-acyl-phospholipid synthase-like methyltransferase
MYLKHTIANYYDATHGHYREWWNLDENLALHYGIWDEDVKSFNESLSNTNRVMAKISGISSKDNVLDAGCGVGGAAFYLAIQKNARVTGITLSQKQVDYANMVLLHQKMSERITFILMDYSKTTFENECFDVVWACESVCHASDKKKFLEESFRLLKPGGRLIMSDFFIENKNQHDPHNLIRKWCELWGVPGLETISDFKRNCRDAGFTNVQNFDYTDKIWKSARRLFYSSLIGFIPSEIYNLFHPGISKFASRHYRSGYFQYKALIKNLWSYNILLAKK